MVVEAAGPFWVDALTYPPDKPQIEVLFLCLHFFSMLLIGRMYEDPKMIKRNTVEVQADNKPTGSAPIGEDRLRSVLTTAYQRLDDLYAKSMESGDTKTAFQVQKELHRLLWFHERVKSDRDQDGAARTSHATDDLVNAQATLARIREHLLPLGLADESYPVQEHARLAAVEISSIRARK